MARYKLTKRADTDLAGLYRYGVRTFGLEQADRYFDSLLAHLRAIADNPKHFQVSEYREGYRRSAHPPHTIYFRIIDAETVEIVRILRGQDPQSSL